MKRSSEARIMLRHGAGGAAMRELIEEVFLPGAQPLSAGIGLEAMDDGAALPLEGGWLILTTDAHVVKPLFFPGGDIGKLAVCGTVNDLAVMGATKPLALTCSLILEEGLSRSVLERVWGSLSESCAQVGLPLVAGDTKIMGRGEIDGLVIATTGVALAPRPISDAGLRPGDQLLVTGTLGDHGFAVMATRHALQIGSELESDVAPVHELARIALEIAGEDLVAMKDPTRGGLASALTEMARKGGVGILLAEPRLPIRPEVRALSELLGIDPLHVACEGRIVMGVRAARAEALVEALRRHPQGRDAAIVGECVSERGGEVILETGFGRRPLFELDGEPLPRIC
ncbi:MAG: hydrogenase expression/formation protein HypE [Myxococcales bacterium]|nr:hydrogenase expression/formation protein HypE [Myxococcales bacterium]